MKKISLLALVALTFCNQLWAETFIISNFKYETKTDGSVSIAKAEGVTLDGELIIPSSITYNGKDYTVSEVGWGGFCNTNITKAVLPKSVVKISDESFSDCPSLQTVILPTYLSSVGRRAFTGCDSLQYVECRVYFPSSLTVNAKAFSNSQFSNTVLYVPKGSLAAYKRHEVLQGFVNIQEKDMEEVDKTMFKFTIGGDNTASVAAYDKNRLEGDVVIPEEVEIDGKTYKVTSVAYEGFYHCTNLTSIALPNTIVGIGDYAFYGCSKLEDVTIPKNVKSFGYGVFSYCNALKDIKVDKENAYFTSKDGMLMSKDGKTLYAYAFAYPTEHLVIPETVVSFYGYGLFEGNKKLQSISVPSGVTLIDDYTFRDCTALTNVYLPDGITNIRYGAFYNCSSLKTITIPQSLNKFGNYVFENCTAVDSVIVRQNYPLEIVSSLFEEQVYQNATLYVPIGRAKYYKDNAGWSKFANIKEIEMEGIVTSDSPFDNIEENQMVLGYYTSDEVASSGYGGENAGRYKVCVRYTKEQMIPFTGNRITNIRFALTNTNILGAKLWAGSTRDKKDLYEQSIPTLEEGWNEVTLQTPVAITGDTIFIGLEYKQSGENFPISAISEGSQEGSYYIYGPYYGSDEDEVWVERDNRSVSIQCIVEGDHIPLYDLHTSGMSINGKYMKPGESYYGYLYLRNWGKKPVSSAKIACEIDGQEVSVKNISEVKRNISSYYVSFKTDENLSAGQHTVTMRVKEINGEVPEFAADDAQSKKVKFYTQDMGRDKVLLELFTGTWCGYCPREHKEIENIMEGRDDIVLLSNHGSDKLSCEASEEYCVFTNYFPATFNDRYASYGATSLGYISVDNAKKLPSLAKLSIQAEYEESSQNVIVTVKGVKNDEFDLVEEYANLTLLLTEDSIISPQADFVENTTHKDYVHNGVLRTNISDIWGDPVMWKGNTFEMRYTYKLNEKWVKDNMHVIAFLAKPFTGTNYEEIGLVNCNDFALRDATNTSGISNTVLSDVDIYVFGRKILVNGKYRSMQVYSVGGSVVDNNNLSAGTYIVKIYTDRGTLIKKIAIR